MLSKINSAVIAKDPKLNWEVITIVKKYKHVPNNFHE